MREIFITICLLIFSGFCFGQSIEDSFSRKKMRKDLKVFREIRIKANSGLYKYRTKEQIDSLYDWAGREIENLKTYKDFYHLICKLTDFEGSLHNSTGMSSEMFQAMKSETSGYFPYPVKMIAGKVVLNFETEEIPLGAELLSINGREIKEIIPHFYKYYTTDGINKTGKTIGINKHFSRYYRMHYGRENSFQLSYKHPATHQVEMTEIKSAGFSAYYKNFRQRHSYSFDRLAYEEPAGDEKYFYKKLDAATGVLTLNSFSIGDDEQSEEHKKYVKFLDSLFVHLEENNIENLVVDVRNNGGGTDPNDVVTYSYLTSRTFQESKEVWINFRKIPLLRHYDSSIPKILRPLGVGKYNQAIQKRFPVERDGKYFINPSSDEMKTRQPHPLAFTGKIYLLISPRVASAGSLFAAMLAGNTNTVTVGEETMGGYYGHNGHSSFDYVLPKSKIKTSFSFENIMQDVPEKENQFRNRGIIPDHEVSQSVEDFLNQKDPQMEFVLELIKQRTATAEL